LKAVVNASQKPAEAVGILTSEHRDTWAKVYSDLMKGVFEDNCGALCLASHDFQ
jgi:hypothetical protein